MLGGPLAQVDTIVGGVVLDVNRTLYYGIGVTLRFLVPDTNQVDNFRTLLVLDTGFDRVNSRTIDGNAGNTVTFMVADTTGNVATIIKTKDLHIEVLDEIFTVGQVPPVGPNEAQIFKLVCTVRKTRKKFFDNAR